jgi:hypothetical protein
MYPVFYILTILLFFFLNCIDSPQAINVKTSDPVDAIGECLLSFGDEGLPEEYLLVKPSPHIAVNYNGDIVVGDERRLKIYDSKGKPKKILGGPGQGPGDYNYAYPLVINDKYITGMDNPFGLSLLFNLYTSDYKLIYKKNPVNSDFNKILLSNNSDWKRLIYQYVYHYDEDERLIYSQVIKKPKIETKRVYTDESGDKAEHVVTSPSAISNPTFSKAVVYQNGIDVQTLVFEEYLIPKSTSKSECGDILFYALPGKRFAYINTVNDKEFSDNMWSYKLTIFDILSKQKKSLYQTYSPVSFPDSIIYRNDYIPKGIEKMTNKTLKAFWKEDYIKREKLRVEGLLKVKYYPPVKELLADGDIIFAFTNYVYEGRGILVDIFDGRTSVFLRSAYFTFIPDLIKNGFAYKLVTGEQSFPRLEKYKVNPNIYTN